VSIRRPSCGVLAAAVSALAATSCESPIERPPAPENEGIYAFANGCYAVEGFDPGEDNARFLAPALGGHSFAFSAESADGGSRFFMKASDLGTYLLYDQEGRYLVGEDGLLERHAKLLSDLLVIDDAYISGAEWELAPSDRDADRFQLKNRKTGHYLARSGQLTPYPSNAAVVTLHAQEGCAEHPELTLDAEGTVEPRRWEDGAVFGIVDTHSHMLTNFAFGGGGVFHGAPFHRLGVEHALPDCSPFHGIDGRSDLMGFAFNQGTDTLDVAAFLPALLFGDLGAFNHHTAGYPEFTDWPAAPFSSTHQTQYYRWLERAYLGGLRLVVQHATSNSAMCDLITGQGIQPVRYVCNDMVAVDRQILEAYNLERYIDAQHGGPGRGWFRIVKSPAEARAVIDEGKLAVILGIEVSNLFDCFLVPFKGAPECDEAFLDAQLDRYHELGVRALFPVHKYDNKFSPGDGHRAISEIGNFANTGHWSSFTLDCPEGVDSVFDEGDVQFGGLNQPREDYFAPPPNDMSGFPDKPVDTMMPFLSELQAPALEGDYCQSHGLTPLGEKLLRGMMQRGMIAEIDHLPRWSYVRAFEILNENDYPATATHGTEYNGRIYENGGVSKSSMGRCADPENPSAMVSSITSRVARIVAAGGYPAIGFGFDLNGFAGAAGPRFGEHASCEAEQTDPVTYPFTSFAGDVTFTEPRIGNRIVDFNTEGMTHIGLMPELIEDARRTGVTDKELEPLFRSAEGYLRMWERAEARSKSIR
jgi:microsomal dipeptidase-like Zn-dependent dipeptidase